jgi:tetratricopeptide (TPR) repeat protein
MRALIEKRVEEVKRLIDTNRLNEASVAAKKLIEDFPGDPEAWRYRAHVFAVRSQYREAVKDISSAIELAPSEPHYYWTRGKYLLEIGDNQAAITDLTKTLQLCDEHKSDYYREAALLLRAEAHLRLGHYDDARQDCAGVSDDATIWVGSVRSKQAILADCK